jgi:hypothetical protein
LVSETRTALKSGYKVLRRKLITTATTTTKKIIIITTKEPIV